MQGNWLYPTSTATKAHFFPTEVHRSLCGKYGRFKGDLGWQTQDGSAPKDACLPCARKAGLK